jgi:hypothetical protein
MRDIDQALVPVLSSPPEAKHAAGKRVFQGIPGMEITPSGRLWATWYGGGATEGPENYVILSTSTDGGGSWREVRVIDPPGFVRAFDPGLWLDPKGRLWWFWSQCYSRQDGHINDGRSGVWVSIADDPENPRWGAPMRIANGVMMNKPTVLSYGAWAFPSAVWANMGGCDALPELKAERFSSVVTSFDEGRTFAFAGGADVPFRCFDEHMVVERGDGRLWMLVRTLYGIGQSFSRDGGRTWTPGCDSLLGGPNSRFFIRRLASGRLLFVNHRVDPENPGHRKNLVATLSEDDGKTWKGELMLDERAGVSYPDGAQAEDGSLWVIYDHDRYRGGNILLVHFTEEDILAGRLVSKAARLRIPVSSYPFKP